jgi:hypothetical protein
LNGFRTRSPLCSLLLVLVSVPGQAAAQITFRDVTKQTGIHFKFSTDIQRGRMISTMGGGVAAGDFDGDGYLDLFFTGSAGNGKKPEKGPCGALYRNLGNGTFQDVTAASGIRACGWQMGAFWVDLDSDGLLDLIVTGVDQTTLWHNLGNGKFEETAHARGLTPGHQFTIAVAAGDTTGTGRVDLYLLGYLDTSPAKELSYPLFQIRLPEDYPPAEGILFRQQADGRFEEATAQAGVANPGGKGTGAVFFDFDGDGKPDLFVANDHVSNRLYRNLGDGTFQDVTDETGAGSRGNRPRAGMGIAIGDPFGTGRPDLYVTNFSGETNTYYRNVEGKFFDDATEETGTGKASWPYVQWGTHFADLDNDGKPDLYAVSGQLVPAILIPLAELFGKRKITVFDQGDRSYRQPVTLWRNEGNGRFADVAAGSGDLGRLRVCARGSAVGDLDGDGRLDLAIAAISGGSRILRNTTEPSGHAIEILPVAGASRRTCLGTKVRVTAGGKAFTQEFILAPSYASGSWVPLHFGLGSAEVAERVEIIRPGETAVSQTFTNVKADRLYRLRDGELSEVRPFSR